MIWKGIPQLTLKFMYLLILNPSDQKLLKLINQRALNGSRKENKR
jgi:hypothetical protein